MRLGRVGSREVPAPALRDSSVADGRVRIRRDQDWDGHPQAEVIDGYGRLIAGPFYVPFPVLRAQVWGLLHGHGWLP